MGLTPFYGARAETPPPKKANFAMKQTNICHLSGDIMTPGITQNCSYTLTCPLYMWHIQAVKWECSTT